MKRLSATSRLPSAFRILVTLAALALTPSTTNAQTSGAPAMTVDGPQVIRAARMFDARAGQIVEGAVVVVDGDRITAVNANRVPDTEHDMDLGNVTLLPGFIDSHTHLANEIGPSSFTAAVTMMPEDAALNGVKYGWRTLQAGSTTVRDFGGGATVALAHAGRGLSVPGHVWRATRE